MDKLKENNICFYVLRIKTDAVDPGKAAGKRTRIYMIVFERINHLLQRNDSRRRQMTGLSGSSAKHFTEFSCFLNEFPRAA